MVLDHTWSKVLLLYPNNNGTQRKKIKKYEKNRKVIPIVYLIIIQETHEMHLIFIQNQAQVL